MSQARSYDVAVAGAGPSGLAAALLLAAGGFRTVQIAPAAPPRDQRTTALLGASMVLLDRLGVGEELARRGAPLRTMRLVDVTGRLVRAPEVAFEAREIGQPHFGINVENRDIVEVLDAAARHAPNLDRIEAMVSEVACGEGAVRLTTSEGETIEAKVAVAADGRHSKLRAAAGIGVRTWDYPQSALVANLAVDVDHDDVSTEFHGRHGPYVLVPLSGRAVSVVLVDTPAEIERLAALDDDGLGLELERRAHSLLGRMRVISARQSFPLSGMIAHQFGAQRVALVGEAGHVFPPIGAQGLNLGMRDVGHLAEVLARARAAGDDIGSARTMAAYDRARRADVGMRSFVVDAADRLLLSDFLPAQLVRGVGLSLAQKVPQLRRLLMREGLAPRFGTPRAMRGGSIAP